MNELGQQQEPQYPKSQQEVYSKPNIQHCQFPICPIHSNSKYCIRRAVGSLVPQAIKKVYNIPKQSERRKRELPIYRRIVADKIKEADGLCVLKLPGCTIYAQGGDHRVKRSPSNYIDPDNIFPACNFCNTEKERLSKLAMETGITISKFNKEGINKILIMGYYIPNKSEDWMNESIQIDKPKSLKEIPDDCALICRVKNPAFTANALIYSVGELFDFGDINDLRPKTWVVINKVQAHRLSGYS